MSIDKHAIEKHVRGILLALGADIKREGLIDTPRRVANMYEELFDGMKYSNQEIADMFNKTFEEDLHLTDCTNDMVIMRDIEVFSHCEHHMALMYDMKITVAYIPNNKILGLSKIARIADMASKRLQIQERLGADIAEIIMLAAKTKDVAVLIEAYHSCVSARGIKKKSSKTYTQTLRGRFNKDATLLESLRQNK